MQNIGVTELGVATLVLLALMQVLPKFVNQIRGTADTSTKTDEIRRIIEVSLAPLGDLSTVMREMNTKVDELHRLHSQTDEDGLPNFWIPTSFKRDVSEMASSIEKLAVSQGAIATALTTLSNNNTKTVAMLTRINEKMPNNGAAKS